MDLNTLKTGIRLRDSPMGENYLETETYLFAELNCKIVQLPTLIMRGFTLFKPKDGTKS